SVLEDRHLGRRRVLLIGGRLLHDDVHVVSACRNRERAADPQRILSLLNRKLNEVLVRIFLLLGFLVRVLLVLVLVLVVLAARRRRRRRRRARALLHDAVVEREGGRRDLRPVDRHAERHVLFIALRLQYVVADPRHPEIVRRRLTGGGHVNQLKDLLAFF